MTAEEWRPVDGYDGAYYVSDHGRVRSYKRYKAGRELTLRETRGYYSVHLCRDGLPRNHYIHQLVALAFLGPRPPGKPHVRHLDGDCRNNHVSNLAFGSVTENMLDTVRHGRHGMARKVQCKRGHSLSDPANIRWSRGRRICRACIREAARAKTLAARS